MNLTELTNYVWAQTDTTEFDLPAATIANYIDEAFARTIAAENRWPSYEKTWDVVVAVGDASSALDTDVNPPAIMSVTHSTLGYRLEQIAEGEGDLHFGSDLETSTVFRPQWFSIWGDTISFWPRQAADAETIFKLRGYRKPLTTFATSGEVDADARLHRPLAHYAVALAYAQQEDEVLERVYMERWQKDVEMARSAIMEPSHNRPVIMHGNFPRTPIGGRRNGSIGFTINNGI